MLQGWFFKNVVADLLMLPQRHSAGGRADDNKRRGVIHSSSVLGVHIDGEHFLLYLRCTELWKQSVVLVIYGNRRRKTFL